MPEEPTPLEDLRAAVEGMAEEQEYLLSRVDNLEHEKDGLRGQLADAKRQIRELEAENAELRERIKSAVSEPLMDIVNERWKLKQRVENLESVVERFRAKAQGCAEMSDKLELGHVSISSRDWRELAALAEEALRKGDAQPLAQNTATCRFCGHEHMPDDECSVCLKRSLAVCTLNEKDNQQTLNSAWERIEKLEAALEEIQQGKWTESGGQHPTTYAELQAIKLARMALRGERRHDS